MHTVEFDNNIEQLLGDIATSQGGEIDAVIKNAVADYLENVLDTLAIEGILKELQDAEE